MTMTIVSHTYVEHSDGRPVMKNGQPFKTSQSKTVTPNCGWASVKQMQDNLMSRRSGSRQLELTGNGLIATERQRYSHPETGEFCWLYLVQEISLS